MRILSAEDDTYQRDCLVEVLVREGHQVDVAVNGQDAWERLMKAPKVYDLVVTDQNMPEMTGMQLVEKMREAGLTQRIVVYAGGLYPHEERRFHWLQVDKVVDKPRLPRLVDAVESLRQ